MCFKRLVLNVCSLSVALNENGKLLNLIETAIAQWQKYVMNAFLSNCLIEFCQLIWYSIVPSGSMYVHVCDAQFCQMQGYQAIEW